MFNGGIASLVQNPWQSARQALQTYWGYGDFRPPQDTVVKALLAQQDAVIVLPTGFGKSVCFQIPAVIGEGLTLIVSPLIALMQDQVQDLWKRRLPAACWHSHTDKALKQRIRTAIRENRLRLLYLSPETLLSPSVWELIRDPQTRLQGLIVDEAHTLVHWGDSFRPDYRRLGCIRRSLGKAFPVAAFTATADPYTQWVLEQVLELRDPEVVRINPLRRQIRLQVQTVWSQAQRQGVLLGFLRQQLPASGLIYVRTRNDGEELAAWLEQQGYTTAAYHAGISPGRRTELEQAWLQGSLTFLVCTNAFGMGINKPDCRWVLHYHPPLSPTDYIQEVGRAGRDGQPATALMLVCEPTGWLDPSDRQRQDFFLAQRQAIHKQALALLPHLPTRGNYTQLLHQARDPLGFKLALALLHQAGCLHWQDPFHFQIRHRPKTLDPPLPAALRSQLRDPLAVMHRLSYGRQCRWQVLLEAFGYGAQPPCGTCDRCQELARPQ